MKRVLAVRCAIGLVYLSSCAFSYSVSTEQGGMSIPNVDSEVSNFDGLKELAQKLIDSGSFNRHADYGFNRELRHQLDQQLRDKSAAKCQSIVREVLGDQLYKPLETIYLGHLESPSIDVRSAAANTLGAVLFSTNVTSHLERLAFHVDKRIQLGAIEALMCLDHSGCDTLVRYAILSGDLPDIVASKLLETLYLKSSASGRTLARELCRMLAGPSTVKAALPMLEGEPNYHNLVRVLLLSDRYDVSETPSLDLIEQTKVSLLCDLMWSVVMDKSSFDSDEAINLRIRAFANSVTHERLYQRALLVLERLGEDVAYFEAMKDRDETPLSKKELLGQIVLRLEQSQGKSSALK